jgi:hypothetical protein
MSSPDCDGLTLRPSDSASGGRAAPTSKRVTEGGGERASTNVAALTDTNVLVYRFDNRFPAKQKIATAILRRGITDDSIRLPHQAILEFVGGDTSSRRARNSQSNGSTS